MLALDPLLLDSKSLANWANADDPVGGALISMSLLKGSQVPFLDGHLVFPAR